MQPIVIDEDSLDPEVKSLLNKKLKQHQNLLASMMLEKDQMKQYEISKGNGKTEEEKEEEYYRNLIEYFKSGCDVDLKGNFEPRFTPDYQDQTLQFEDNSVVVYGVDFMSTPRVVKYFRYFDPDIQWVDDSSCKVILKNHETVLKMFDEFQDTKQQGAMEEQGIDKRKWYPLKSYLEFGLQKKLSARIATNMDKVKNTQEGETQFKFFAYDILKKRLQEKTKAQMKQKRSQLFNMERRPRRPFERNNNNREYNNREYNNRNNDRNFNRRDFDRNSERNNNRHKRIHKQYSVNYSFARNRQREFDEQSEQNQSFQRGDPQHSMFADNENINLNISRANYSFVRDTHIKEEADRVEQNHSFRRENVEQSIRDLMDNMSNLSFSRKENEVIVIDD